MSAGAIMWRPTVLLPATAALAAATLVTAALLHRPDLVIVAAPLLLVVVAAAVRPRPGSVALPVIAVPNVRLIEGDEPLVRITAPEADGVDIVRLGIQHSDGLEPLDVGTVLCVSPGEVAQIPLRATRWGIGAVGPVHSRLVAGHGLFSADPPVTPRRSMAVTPRPEAFATTASVPAALGLVGGHRSHRLGDGTDIAQVRPFVTGDRLRRVSWSASARTGRLHVTATYDDLDLEIQLLIDSAVDIAGSRPDAASSLDIAVRAASAIGEYYLRSGDRVGLIDLASRRRPVPAKGGRRHLVRLQTALLDASPAAAAIGRSGQASDPRLGAVSPRALVVVFSALLDDAIAGRVAGFARRGNPTVVVDTLPAGARPPGRGHEDHPGNDATTALAWRLALLRRDTVSARLTTHGVPVVGWQGAGSLDHVLTRLSRSAAAPRRRR